MNPILIVLPILTLLMFDLGLELDLQSFRTVLRNPKSIFEGLAGQLLILPLLAFFIAWLFDFPPVFFIGLILVACSPGGSSSNVFSMLAKGNVALSVTLTFLSSIITLFTIPLILGLVLRFVPMDSLSTIRLPVGKLMIQNLVLMLLPIFAGILVKNKRPLFASKLHRILQKMAFPLLLLLVTIFFIQHKETITLQIGTLGGGILLLILFAVSAGWILSRLMGISGRDRRTIVIEVGMQNAAQAIAIASSPFVFNNDILGVPAIIYALLMNVVLLSYLVLIRFDKNCFFIKK